MLFQNLCSSKLDWNGQLEGETIRQWNSLPSDIKSLSYIRVQRCLFNHQVISHQLHRLCDASEKAFAAVVYIHIEYEHIPPDIQLVASKARVVPVKKQSIPWLEVLGATILA